MCKFLTSFNPHFLLLFLLAPNAQKGLACGIIQNGGIIYSEYSLKPTDVAVQQQPRIYTHTGKGPLPGSNDITAHVYVDCVLLYICIFQRRNWSRAINWIERGNFTIFWWGGGRKLHKEVGRNVKQVYPISLES
jgi:hypothetical protein